MDTPTLPTQQQLDDQHAGDDAAVADRKRQQDAARKLARARSDWQPKPMGKTWQEIARWRREHPALPKVKVAA